MKKQLLLLLFALISLQYQSQLGLNNMSFENWSNNLIGPAPTGWFGTGLTKKTSGAQQGSNYVSLTSGTNNSGFMMLGVISGLSGTFTGGTPYSQMPVSISGFYKASGTGTASTVPFMNAYTKESGQVNMMAMMSFSVDQSNWTSFSAQFFPINGNTSTVDSMFIMFNTGNFGSSPVLDLDNLSLLAANPVGIDAQSVGTSFLVYPNPAQNELNIVSKNEKAVSLSLMSLDGKLVKSEKLQEGDNKINLENYPAGIYIYQIMDQDQNILLRSKVTLQR